jgi:cobalt-zinc-cadmium efflux system protein
MPHGHDHHSHAHAHHHHAPATGRHDAAFAIGVGLNLALVLGEVWFGLAAHSIALVADGGHNAGDVLGLVMAWVAAVLSRRPPTSRRTYGYGRSSILASLANAVLLLIAVGAIALEAVQRLISPGPVAGGTVMWVALAGIAVNGVTACLFMRGRAHDLNIRGAFLHMAADAAVSLGVVAAAIVIQLTGWVRLDPLVSLVIVVVIAWGTWGLLRESFDLAMDVVPDEVNRGEVETYLRALPGVTEVHDLHIWSLSTTEIALTAHLVRPGAGTDDAMLHDLCHDLRHRFGIGHATFQVESGDAAHPCALAPAHVI